MEYPYGPSKHDLITSCPSSTYCFGVITSLNGGNSTRLMGVCRSCVGVITSLNGGNSTSLSATMQGLWGVITSLNGGNSTWVFVITWYSTS